MIIVLVGPLAVFQALELMQVKSTRTRLTQQQAYDLAKAGAARYQDIINDARSVLDLLSKVAEVTSERSERCSHFLLDVVRTHPWARGLFVANSANRITCGTVPASLGFDLSGREWFQSARAAGPFSVSDFVLSQITKQPSAFATLFFRNERTGEQQVVAAGLDLAWLDRLSATINERKDALVMLVDGNGVILSRYPASPMPGFARIPEHLKQHATEPTRELFAGLDPDGKDRLFGSFSLSGANARVIVGFDRSDALGLIDMFIGIAAAVFLGVMLVGILIVWFMGDRIFVRPIEVLNALLKTTLDTMDQGLIAIDRNGRASVINTRALKLLDLPSDLANIHPHQDDILKHQFARGEFASLAQFNQISKDIADRRHGIYERRRPNGTVLEIRSVPTDDGGIVRTYSDITRRRVAEENLMREKERAVAAADAASEFLANMSHELRTPLTAIIGISEMLLNEEPSPEKQRRFMQMQRNAGQALLSVINDILDFSKIEAGQLQLENEAFSLDEAINYCMSIVGGLAKQKSLTLSVNISNKVPRWILGDSGRLRQVLINLLSNGVKFTQRGSVTLSVETVSDSGNLIRFVVADTGVGIAPEYLPKIFERFSQADSSTTRRFGGTGLGLAISKRLVHLMGGEIEVASIINTGSRFAFTAKLPASHRPRSEFSVPLPRSASYRLLLAEDNELNRQLITAMLEQAGHHVQVVNDGAEACRVAVRNHFDAILMDVQMPELDGYAAATLIRKAIPGSSLPIIALTANALSDEAERCLRAGMSAYFSKPIDWPGLFASIDQLVSESRNGRSSAYADDASRLPLKDMATLNTDTLDRIRNSIGHAATKNLLNLFIIDAEQSFLSTEPHRDDDEIGKEAHSFGGSAGMLGLERLSNACSALNAPELSQAEFEIRLGKCRIERDIAIAEVKSVLGESSLASGATGWVS